MQIKKVFISSILLAIVTITTFSMVQSDVVNAQTPAVCVNPTSPDIAQACKDFAEESVKLKELQAQLAAQKSKSGALQGNVNQLINQINSTQNKIKGQINTISSLSSQIGEKQKAINALTAELDRQHDSMRQLVKRTNELDQKGAIYVMLSSKSVTDFYQDLDDFLSIKQSLYASLHKVKEIKSVTEGQKVDLQDKQSRALDAKNSLEFQKKQIQSSEAQARILLNTSKTAEQKQASLVADQQKKVATIQSKLFSFAGGATKAIAFKDAYEYAQNASALTGVRAAFILATLTQESNLGRNVGTCNRAGDPPSKSYTAMMNPTRDIPPFIRITKSLGLDPNTTPISCRIGTLGWGGGMGPAQFIPSTWEAYDDKVAVALGKPIANPWIAADAIMASALLHKANGAVGGEANERNAACRYYSGKSCVSSKPGAGYGNSVMALTRSIQADIDYLEKYGVSRR